MFGSKNFFKEGKCRQAGFIKTILIIIAALVLLKYVFDIDVVGFLTQGKFKELLDKFYELGAEGWEKYKDVLIRAWEYIIDLAKDWLDKVK